MRYDVVDRTLCDAMGWLSKKFDKQGVVCFCE
jgi:hypothetical protein